VKSYNAIVKKIYFLLIFFCCTPKVYTQQPTYENLVFEGAGIRGIAYSGVLYELEKNNMMPQIKNVGGTSAGAITALMLSLGYTSSEVYSIIADTKFQKFNDGAFFFVGGYSRMRKRYGWYKSNKFEKWLQEIIHRKTGNPDITFAELERKGFKKLYITGTCLNKQQVIIFSAETYPTMKVKDAVRISMSIPLYFEAGFIDKEGVVYKKRKERKVKEANGEIDVVVDGGILANFPIFIFDSIVTDSTGVKKRIPNTKITIKLRNKYVSIA
jgi:NTE family protein